MRKTWGSRPSATIMPRPWGLQYDAPKPIPEDRLMPNSDLQTVGTKHVAFLVNDMAALKKDFVANGVDIAHEVHMGTDSVMFIRDCNGVLIEFIQK